MPPSRTVAALSVARQPSVRRRSLFVRPFAFRFDRLSMRQLAAVPDDHPSSSVDLSDSCDNAASADNVVDQGLREPPPIFCTNLAPPDDDDHPFTPTSGATNALYASGTRSSLAPDDAFRDQTPSPSGSGGKLRTVSQSSCLSSSSATSPTQRSPKRVSFLVSETETDDKAEWKPLKEPGHALGAYSDGGVSRNKRDYVKNESCCCAVM